MPASTITIALTKGRILDDALPLLEAAGIRPAESIADSRKLLFATNAPDVRLLVLRGQDVLTYVRYGAADVGICGKDMMLEYGADGTYELVDLKIACCRLMTAAPVGAGLPSGRIRVATKFVNVAKAFFAEQGRQADIIPLYGAMELAPAMGLSDWIVDIVDSGKTLKANGLEARDCIAEISSRLIANKAAMKLKHDRIQALADQLAAAVSKD